MSLLFTMHRMLHSYRTVKRCIKKRTLFNLALLAIVLYLYSYISHKYPILYERQEKPYNEATTQPSYCCQGTDKKQQN